MCKLKNVYKSYESLCEVYFVCKVGLFIEFKDYRVVVDDKKILEMWCNRSLNDSSNLILVE